MKTLLGSLLLPLPLLLAACSDTPSPPVDSAEPPPVDTAEAQAAEATEPPAAQRLEASELGSTTPVHAFGDVLLCSGQSNMVYPVVESFYGAAERAAADHPIHPAFAEGAYLTAVLLHVH